jgi:hypothetical protein
VERNEQVDESRLVQWTADLKCGIAGDVVTGRGDTHTLALDDLWKNLRDFKNKTVAGRV